MEVVGAAASFIAIGQALIAGRHVFNILRSIPEISKEFEALDYEVGGIASALRVHAYILPPGRRSPPSLQ